MALLDHFTRNAGTEPGDNGFERFPAHQFAAGMVMYLTDNLVRNKTINDFGLTVDDQLQYDDMKTVYDGKNAAGKNIYLHVVRACLEQLEQEQMTKANAAGFLEITNA